MSNIFYAEPELVIALAKRVIFVNPNDLQIFKEIVIPDDLSKCVLETRNISIDNVKEQNDDERNLQTLSKEPPTIKHVKMSPDHQLVALTTSGQKALLLYRVRPEYAKLESIRVLARTSSALAFNKDSKRLLITDKTGDCYEYDCEQHDSVPKLLFGHLSIVYDILWSSDEKFIITCDRDDKIRVTNYPATYDVHSYCLGHKEFVSAVEFLNDDVIISISGDKTMKLWEFKEGKYILSIDLPAPGIKIAVRRLMSNNYEISVLLHEGNKGVVTYVLRYTENKWGVSSPQMLSFNSMNCGNLCYAQDRLYVTGLENDRFTIKVSEKSSGAPLNWIQMVEKQFEEYAWNPEDISAWFKKKYDNVSEYLERKKRRIEDKHK